jgi:hypothetical protein
MRFICPRCSHVSESATAPAGSCPACGYGTASLPTVEVTTPYDPAATRAFVAGLVPESLSLGTVGGYCLLREVGAGGMGTVYEAEQVGTGRRVALKLIRSEFSASEAAVDRFRREGRFASTVTHPRCVFVLTADEDRGRPYIAMELMPGATLKDLVAERGPLPPAEAVALTLDVIDGLEALHRRGIIHRDVKPGNCFIEDNGRVKVGDFGLALSLLSDADPEQKGRFAGTPLFASPEQHRGEELDARTDVWSVSATLYYLLTGRAPHQGGDTSSVLKRAAAEPAPPMRQWRPELPAALDRIVRRGLERDRARRWEDLGELKLALLRFGPARLSSGGVWLRVGAYLVDYFVVLALIYGLGYPLFLLLRLWWPDLSIRLMPAPTIQPCTWLVTYDPGIPFLAAAPEILYFGLLEGLYGCAVGKWLFGLRVFRTGAGRPPGLARALGRAAFFCLLMYLPRYLLTLGTFPCALGCLLGLLSWWNLGGLLVVASTMRERNGYRGLHDFLFQTTVTRVSWPGRAGPERYLRRPCPDRLASGAARPAGAPERVGPFSVTGAVCWRGGAGVLLGEDVGLGRKVLLWLRGAGEPALSPARRDLNRLSRLHWLTDGTLDGVRWDAFVAESGCPLTEFIAQGSRLAWEGGREFLRQLTDELAAACAEGTLPQPLTLGRVWVRQEGHALLLDMPADPAEEPDPPQPASDERRALALLDRVAVLTLEGTARPVGGPPVRAPLPLHAAAMLARLQGGPSAFQRVEEFRQALVQTQDRPVRVGRGRRAFHLCVQTGLLMTALAVVLITVLLLPLSGPTKSSPAKASAEGAEAGGSRTNVPAWVPWLVALGVPVLVGVTWAGLARGGPSFGLCGIALVRADGRRAARWQAALRCLLVWLQAEVVAVGLFAAWMLAVIALSADPKETGWVPWLVIPGCLLVYVVLTAWLPRRTLHDRLARTYLVPK